MSRRNVVFMVAALLVAVMSFQLNATMLSPAIRDIETELGDGSFAGLAFLIMRECLSDKTFAVCGAARRSPAWRA